ncbi:MAG: winged helix-turn-helix transcriptional regulator [Thermoplasmata archaeon]|nr:MAG: winged helix-turn-helix transcriptional regulator [Thermoplasmata archaeon]KAA0018426.1 MAG: winged helix-turn-helix transcriptional regulator [Thermoplasmata archaeon]
MGEKRSPLLDGAISDVKILERHLKVLKAVIENEPIGIIRLSQKTGLPLHAVRYSLRILEGEGLIEPSKSGAITTDKVHEALGTIESTLDNLVTTLKDIKRDLKERED